MAESRSLTEPSKRPLLENSKRSEGFAPTA